MHAKRFIIELSVQHVCVTERFSKPGRVNLLANTLVGAEMARQRDNIGFLSLVELFSRHGQENHSAIKQNRHASGPARQADSFGRVRILSRTRVWSRESLGQSLCWLDECLLGHASAWPMARLSQPRPWPMESLVAAQLGKS